MFYGLKSDKGQIRDLNEDYIGILPETNGGMSCFIIADGMGGHNSGELASKTAVESVLESIRNYSASDNIPNLIEKAIIKANTDVLLKAEENETNFGMGTTLIVLVIEGNKLYFGHIGDSRAYLITGETINQLTADHSYIEELIRSGSINREEALNHPQRNLLTRAIGGSEEIEIDKLFYEGNENDIILLCTDGLVNMLNDEEIISVINNYPDLQQASDELVRLANEKGGEDNISVILVKI